MMSLFEEELRLNLEELKRFVSLLFLILYDYFTYCVICIRKLIYMPLYVNCVVMYNRHDIRIWIIGDRGGLPESFIEVIIKTEEKTKVNTRLRMILAINYGGQFKIIEIIERLCKKVKDGLIDEEEINDKIFEHELWIHLLWFRKML